MNHSYRALFRAAALLAAALTLYVVGLHFQWSVLLVLAAVVEATIWLVLANDRSQGRFPWPARDQ